MSKRIPKRVMNSAALKWSPFPRKHNFDKPLTKMKPRIAMEQPGFEDNPWKKGRFPKHTVKMKILPPSTIPEITPIENWPIVVGDRVEVMVGPDTGKQGLVRAIGKYRNQVKVEGLNLRHLNSGGQHLLIENPLHYNEVKLVDPSTGTPTDVVVKYTADGEWVRVCTATQRVIMKPIAEKEAKDGIVEGPKDTPEAAVTAQTHTPSMLLFHEEIMKEMNIPMSIPKVGPERRDLIMQEIAEDVVAQRERERLIDEEEMVQKRGTPVVDKIKSFMPWGK